MGELKRVDREFQVDQPAGPKLDVERSGWRLVPRHLLAHRRGVGPNPFGIGRGLEDRADEAASLGARPRQTRSDGRARHSAICSQVQASLR